MTALARALIRAGLVFADLVLAAGLLTAQSGPIVQVTGGRIRGEKLAEAGAVFKGIPYAQPPTNERRWREPMPVKAWTSVRDATRFSAICPQSARVIIPNAAELSSEDCLYLNVWTAEWPVTRHSPVLLWFPGGGNISGASSELRQSGEYLAQRGIVVVTINYRLGSLGFYSHPALTRESPHQASGNQGLLDQVAALEWVRANIAQFGGDPENITLGGNSAGGIDTSALMTSPLTAGKFRRAIVQSGPARNVLGPPLPLPVAEGLGAKHATLWGVPENASLQELRAVPWARILKAQPARPVPHLNISIDGYVVPTVPADVFAAGTQHKTPLLMGSAARDFAPGAPPPADLDALIEQTYGPLAARARSLYAAADPVYGTPAVQWATDTLFRCPSVMQLTQHSTVGQTTFAYEFARLTQPEIQPGGNIHGLDGDYALGTFRNRSEGTQLAPYELTPDDATLSERMQQYWVNFVKTGDPNGPGLPHWPAFDSARRAYLRFSESGDVVKEGLRRAQCDLYIENLKRAGSTQGTSGTNP